MAFLALLVQIVRTLLQPTLTLPPNLPLPELPLLNHHLHPLCPLLHLWIIYGGLARGEARGGRAGLLLLQACYCLERCHGIDLSLVSLSHSLQTPLVQRPSAHLVLHPHLAVRGGLEAIYIREPIVSPLRIFGSPSRI